VLTFPRYDFPNPRDDSETVNDMKSLEQQGASARGRETNVDAIRQNQNPQCGKCGLNHGKNCPAQGTRCRNCNQWNHWQHVCRKKQTTDRRNKPPPRPPPENRTPQDRSNPRSINVVDESNPDLDELLFESIQLDSSTANPARDEAFPKVLVELPNVNHPKPMLKLKVDTGAQGNILPLRIYRNMFPEHIDDYGLPTGTTPTPTKLTAYNGAMVTRRLMQCFMLLMLMALQYVAYPPRVSFRWSNCIVV